MRKKERKLLVWSVVVIFLAVAVTPVIGCYSSGYSLQMNKLDSATETRDTTNNLSWSIGTVDYKGFVGRHMSIAPGSNKYPINFLPAQITITRPQPGRFYLFDREVLPLPFEKTIIIGKITIFVSAIDPIYGIKTVDFIIDGEITHTCFFSPYFWTWNTRTYTWGNYILTVTATSGNDEKFSDQMDITVLSLRGGG